MTSSPAAISHGHRPGSARAALAYPDYRRMWISSFLSAIGSWMQNVVLPVYVLDRTGNASLVGVIVFAQLGPQLFLSIPAGVIADRFDRRRWIIGTQVVQLVFAAALAPLASNDAPFWAIFTMALGVGIGNSLTAPAWSAMLPTLVSRADLPGSVSLSSASLNASRVAAPILVAVLRSVGASVADIFLINAATYLFVIVAVARTRIPTPVPEQDRAQGLAALMSGIRIVRSRPALRRVVGTMIVFSLVSLPYIGLLPVVARENFGVAKGSTTYEWLYAIWATGAAFGGLAVGTLFVSNDKRRLVRSTMLAFAVCLSLFALGRNVLSALLVAPVLGFAYFAMTTSLSTIYQGRLHDHERGRTMALWFMSFGGTVPVGNVLFAPVMDLIGVRWTLLIGAVTAVGLAWWCDIESLDRRSPDEFVRDSIERRHPAALHEHGVAGGE